ncbi:conserved domain protein [Bacteroides sp. CAG:875]|nr:conserved domain protein [Bacteroides sp. CAG:875]
MGVFQQTGRTDGNGSLDGIEEGEKVFHQTVGQLGPEESLQNHVVGGIAQGYLVQLVGVHELIEHIGTKHHGFRNHDRGVFKLVELGMTLHHVIDKGQSAPLASQRAVADAGKIGITVETVALEHGYHALVFHLAVFHDGFENNLPMCVDVLKGFPRNLFQELGHREDGTRIQPARDVVAADVVEEGFGRNGENHVLKFLQVMNAGHFLQGMGVAEDEVAETEIVRHGFAQIDVHLLGVLIDEHGIQFRGISAVAFFGRLKNQGNKWITATYLAQQAYPCFRVVYASTGKTGIGNDAQHVVLVLVIQVHGFLVRTGQHDFRTTAHAQRTLVLVQGFGGKLLALAEHELVEIGQHGRIEADRIFHEQNHLYANFLDVVLQVHLVLNQFDDGDQQVGISQPAEHVFKNAQVLVFHPFLDAMRKRSQHHQRQMGILPLDVAGNVEGVTIVRTRHADDQVEHGVA